MKKFVLVALAVTVLVGSFSCVRASKKCKKDHKRVKNLNLH
jgi:hypothetical protein